MTQSDNPYSVGTAQAPVLDNNDASSQMRRYKADEAQQKAPKALPFILNNSIKIVGDIFTNLVYLKQSINSAASSSEIRKDIVNELDEAVDGINERLLKIPKILDKLAL